eukprot:scaffold179_cov373-Pavlova_lutheri.AAC.8
MSDSPVPEGLFRPGGGGTGRTRGRPRPRPIAPRRTNHATPDQDNRGRASIAARAGLANASSPLGKEGRGNAGPARVATGRPMEADEETDEPCVEPGADEAAGRPSRARWNGW